MTRLKVCATVEMMVCQMAFEKDLLLEYPMTRLKVCATVELMVCQLAVEKDLPMEYSMTKLKVCATVEMMVCQMAFEKDLPMELWVQFVTAFAMGSRTVREKDSSMEWQMVNSTDSKMEI
jgi:antitoxin component of RelBE/YafQ-DinJ toxin-antitoxin module